MMGWAITPSSSMFAGKNSSLFKTPSLSFGICLDGWVHEVLLVTLLLLVQVTLGARRHFISDRHMAHVLTRFDSCHITGCCTAWNIETFAAIAIVGRTCTGFWTHIKRISRRDTGTFRELDLKRRSFAMLDWGAWNPCLLHLSAAGTELTHLTFCGFCGLVLVTTNCSEQRRRQLQISKDNGLNLRRGWSGHLQRAVFRCSSISHRQVDRLRKWESFNRQTRTKYLFKIV